MATTIDEIKGFLDNLKLKYEIATDRPNHILTGFTTHNYVDEKGRHTVFIAIALEENGEFLKVIAPSIYKYKDGPNKLALFQACLMACWRTKMLQMEFDDADGEVRALIEFPLEDAKLTQRQLARIVSGLAKLVDDFDPAFRRAIDTGQISFDGIGGISRQLSELVAAAGGASPEDVAAVIAELKRRKGADGGKKPPERL